MHRIAYEKGGGLLTGCARMAARVVAAFVRGTAQAPRDHRSKERVERRVGRAETTAVVKTTQWLRGLGFWLTKSMVAAVAEKAN